MSELLVHIGYHKTGSTWLQKKLFRKGSTVFEPLSIDGAGKTPVAFHFVLDQSLENLLSPFDLNQQVIEQKIAELTGQIEDSGKNKIKVLSLERLSGSPTHGGFDSKVIAERIHQSFPIAKILIVIREQRDIILSNYFHYLRQGGVHNLSKFISNKDLKRSTAFSYHHFEYLPLIKYYRELFGASNVCVIPHELLSKDPVGFTAQIADFLDVKLSPPTGDLKTPVNTKNHSFLYYYTRWFGYFARKNSFSHYSSFYIPKFDKIRKLIFHYLLGILFDRYDKNIIRKLYKIVDQKTGNRYEKSNKELGELLGISLKSYGYK